MSEEQRELFDFEEKKRPFSQLGNMFPRNSEHKFAFTIHAERLVFIAILMVLVMVVVYALGVERGRSSRGGASRPKTIVVQSTIPQAVKNVQAAGQAVIKQSAAQVAPKSSAPAIVNVSQVSRRTVLAQAVSQVPTAAVQDIKPYTIVVATFSRRDTAVAELGYLKREGYQASLFSSDPYFIVCVGNYESKEAATSALGAVRKRYKDAFVKKR